MNRVRVPATLCKVSFTNNFVADSAYAQARLIFSVHSFLQMGLCIIIIIIRLRSIKPEKGTFRLLHCRNLHPVRLRGRLFHKPWQQHRGFAGFQFLDSKLTGIIR